MPIHPRPGANFNADFHAAITPLNWKSRSSTSTKTQLTPALNQPPPAGSTKSRTRPKRAMASIFRKSDERSKPSRINHFRFLTPFPLP